MRYIYRPLLLVLACHTMAPTLLDAQRVRDTTIVAGPEYRASRQKQKFFGEHYRDLWTTPLRVEVLDLATFAGGLTPTELGGGRQTKSLRFRGADGREYAFRSVNKSPDLTQEPALKGTFVAEVIQDQTSSLHPTAALVVPPLLDAVGVRHATPRLVVMPDDPRLGEFREAFAGTLGQLEERPEDVEDGGAGFGGMKRIIGTDRLFERIEESAEDRVDATEYLKARLMDLVFGDWDRHHDQWRWGEVERGGNRHWLPIPRDRDYAFVDYDGAAMDLARRVAPNAVRFESRISNLGGLTLNARGLDRRILAALDRRTWDSVTTFVQSRLTDSIIDAAVQRVPPELRQATTSYIAGRLKGRRDSLGAAATDFYGRLATEVDVHATDEADLGIVERTGEGTVEVRLLETDRAGAASSDPYYRRVFRDAETAEVRIYLHGGDDRLVVRGDVGKSLMLRVVGGGGDDVLADSSFVREGRARTAFYDGRGDNRFIRGRATAVEAVEYEPPELVAGLSGETYRDWGAAKGMAPVVGYTGTDGLILGVGPTYTRYGFWKEPYSYRLSAAGMVGLGSGGVALQLSGDIRNTASRGGYSFLMRASELESIRFYGLGNETVEDQPNSFYVVRQDQLLGRATVNFGLPATGRLSVGPIVKYTSSSLPPGTPFARENPYGANFGQVGALAEVDFDLRDSHIFPSRGGRVEIRASGYPAAWDASPFSEAHGVATGYWTPSMAWKPTLALRAGGKKLWGEFPLHEAAFLGGSRTIRGYEFQRYAGDAMAFGNAEVRAPLGTVKLLVRGTLGLHGLADVGRVYLNGEPSGEWHRSAGGGLWFRFRIRNAQLGWSLTLARGSTERLYFKLGAPF